MGVSFFTLDNGKHHLELPASLLEPVYYRPMGVGSHLRIWSCFNLQTGHVTAYQLSTLAG